MRAVTPSDVSLSPRVAKVDKATSNAEGSEKSSAMAKRSSLTVMPAEMTCVFSIRMFEMWLDNVMASESNFAEKNPFVKVNFVARSED